jgi:hypothetical protein
MGAATLISSAEVPGKSVATMDVELRPTCGQDLPEFTVLHDADWAITFCHPANKMSAEKS